MKYLERIPQASEFNDLSRRVKFAVRDEKVVDIALSHSLYSICVYDEDRLIGYGRIIGDETIFVYIHSIMVDPLYQGQNIGTTIVKKLIDKCLEYRKMNSELRIYLSAVKGSEKFYEKLGFISREDYGLGKAMVYNK